MKIKKGIFVIKMKNRLLAFCIKMAVNIDFLTFVNIAKWSAMTLGITIFSIMTLSIMTISIMTLSIMTLIIITLSIMTLSIMTLSIMTLSIMTFSITIYQMRHSA